jgi:hypothetical protein
VQNLGDNARTRPSINLEYTIATRNLRRDRPCSEARHEFENRDAAKAVEDTPQAAKAQFHGMHKQLCNAILESHGSVAFCSPEFAVENELHRPCVAGTCELGDLFRPGRSEAPESISESILLLLSLRVAQSFRHKSCDKTFVSPSEGHLVMTAPSLDMLCRAESTIWK